MTESIKQIADKLFGANPAPKELTLEEMLRYRAKSKEMLQNRIKIGKRKSITGGKEKVNATGAVFPCPRCGVTNWNVFPDGRKMCLNCHFLDEKTDLITCEFKCSRCHEVIQSQGKDIEAAKKKVVPHKLYDPTTQCEGVFTFDRQVFPNPEPTPIPETRKTEKPSMEHVKGAGIIERFQHPKLGKFVCNKCPYLNDCLQRYEHTDTCLKISIDLKLRKMNDLLLQLLQK